MSAPLKNLVCYNFQNESAPPLRADRCMSVGLDEVHETTRAECINSVALEGHSKRRCAWNPRDQMTKAEKFTGTGDAYAGKVEYEYCLSCDGALSKRREYSTSVSTKIIQERRYEYDGLNLLRVDQRVDSDGDGEIEVGETAWRHVEVNSHRPGSLGAQLGKRAYLYASGQSTTPSSTTDYAYVYDPVGNVWALLSDDGEEVYWFSQDAGGIRPKSPSPHVHGHR